MVNTITAWTRSKDVPYPSIWTRFKGRREIDGVTPSFWIQDIAEEEYTNVVNHMIYKYLHEEPIGACLKLTSDPESVEELRRMWRNVLQERLGLICYMKNQSEGESIIAAMNCLHVLSKCDKTFSLRDEKTARCMSPLNFLSTMKNPFEFLGVETFLNGVGLYVLPQFRGQGLGLELLKAREPLCLAIGIKATLTAFSAKASQISAERAGFRHLSTVYYADLEATNPVSGFLEIQRHKRVLKYMYKMY